MSLSSKTNRPSTYVLHRRPVGFVQIRSNLLLEWCRAVFCKRRPTGLALTVKILRRACSVRVGASSLFYLQTETVPASETLLPFPEF
jgi:hypothetical protein